jgi:hypothetical protein
MPTVDLQQTVSLHAVELGQAAAEVVVEVDVPAPLDVGEVEPEVADQPGDDIAADLVVAVQLDAAEDRQAAGVDVLVVARRARGDSGRRCSLTLPMEVTPMPIRSQSAWVE